MHSTLEGIRSQWYLSYEVARARGVMFATNLDVFSASRRGVSCIALIAA